MQVFGVLVSLLDNIFENYFRKMAKEMRRIKLFWVKMFRESCFQVRNHRSGMERTFLSHFNRDMQ